MYVQTCVLHLINKSYRELCCGTGCPSFSLFCLHVSLCFGFGITVKTEMGVGDRVDMRLLCVCVCSHMCGCVLVCVRGKPRGKLLEV